MQLVYVTLAIAFQFNGYKLLDVVAILNADPSLRDEIAVYITTYHKEHMTYFVALNNRGLATLCLAKLKPIRILPAIATVDELARLTEIVPSLPLPISSANCAQENKVLFNQLNLQTTGPYLTITGNNEIQQPVFTVYAYNSDMKHWNHILYQ
jgi:hypothetical protein